MFESVFINKRIAFISGDPAGAKAMIALSKLYGKDSSTIHISDRKFVFFDQMNEEVDVFHDEILVYKKLDSFSPDLIFTGTSLPASLELKCLKYAKKNKVESASFIDHWTNIKERFIDESLNIILPDIIYLIDKYAYDLALKIGLPKSKIKIISNPYYNWLKLWKPNKSRTTFLDELKLNNDVKYIVFAPEPLDKFNLKEKYGFNEYDILKDLDQLFKIHFNNDFNKFKFIFKIHPNITIKEVSDKIISNLGLMPRYLKIESNIDFNHLTFYSSSVLGFFSNSLIEASILGVPTFRILYKLNTFKLDPFKNYNLGTKIMNQNKLDEIFKQYY